MYDRLYEKDVAITGIGQSEVGRPSTLWGMRLTLDACLEAISDAGRRKVDIDGIACWSGDKNNGDSFWPGGALELKDELGMEANWFGGGYEGQGPLAGTIIGPMRIAR